MKLSKSPAEKHGGGPPMLLSGCFAEFHEPSLRQLLIRCVEASAQGDSSNRYGRAGKEQAKRYAKGDSRTIRRICLHNHSP